MTENEYIAQRLDDQIEWYDRKSMWNQKWYKRLKTAEFVLAASVPVLVAFVASHPVIKVVIAAAGSAVAVISAVHGLYNFHENWIEYRSVCEALKREKHLYLTRSGIYAEAENPFSLLVDRAEKHHGTGEGKLGTGAPPQGFSASDGNAGQVFVNRLVNLFKDGRLARVLLAVDARNDPVAGLSPEGAFQSVNNQLLRRLKCFYYHRLLPVFARAVNGFVGLLKYVGFAWVLLAVYASNDPVTRSGQKWALRSLDDYLSVGLVGFDDNGFLAELALVHSHPP